MRDKQSILPVSILIITFLVTSVSHAQTTYEQEPGLFTPVVKSLYLQGGFFEDTQLIGPAVGYRFNNKYDLSLHTEFLNTESTVLANAPKIQLSILNIGITAGQTNHWKNGMQLRNEISMYQSINLNIEGYQAPQNPTLTSVLGVSSLYKQLNISGSITLFPNVGGLLGVGEYRAPFYSSANLRQGFDGFIAGPQLGLDTKFSVNESFSITAKPQYRLRYNFTNEASTGTLTFNVLFNF